LIWGTRLILSVSSSLDTCSQVGMSDEAALRQGGVTAQETPRGYALTESLGPDEVVGIPRLLSTSLTLRPVVAAITDGLPPCWAIWANWERFTVSPVS
jgi:hypothetical protein